MKRKTLTAELLEARKEEIDAADAKRRKQILKEIEKAVQKSLKEERIRVPSIFIIR
jgi:hypothetical protein